MVDLQPDEDVDAPVDPVGHDTPVDADERENAARPGTSSATAGLALAAFGGFLAIAYFPLVFNKFARYDDEGFYLTSIRAFLKHGSLYSHTRSAYGPFYYSVMGLVYRVTGQQPTLFNGRMIVLVLAAITAGIFGATVFRVTRHLMLTLVCQLASFITVMKVAGNEPMHPAGLILLLVSILAYALVSFAMTDQTKFLAIAGAAAGALMMCKINVGLFAVAAIVMGFVIGNREIGKTLRALVAIAVVALPFALVLPRFYQVQYVQLGALVGLALLATLAPLSVDEVSFPVRGLLTAAIAAVGAVVVSAIWPLLNGTTPGEFVKGVITAPLKQVDHLAIAAKVDVAWLPIVLTAVGVYYALSHRNTDDREPTLLGNALLPSLLLVVAGLWVFGLALGFSGFQDAFGAFLPAIALIGALAWTSAVPPRIRVALRFLVPLAILQTLHAYPVAGSQKAWSTVAVYMPCAIAIAVGLERLPAWRETRALVRWVAVAAFGLAFTLSAGLWPVALWHEYQNSTALALPGTRLVRVDKRTASTLKALTREVKHNCDTFYSAPGFDSLYVFTGLTPPTGLLTNHAGVLNTNEQTELAGQIAAVHDSGKRMCIVRDLTAFAAWERSSYGRGPLGAAVAPYDRVVGKAGSYTVSARSGGS